MASTGVISRAADQTGTDSQIVEEVVVTGTLIRGVQPTGSLPIGISKDSITEKGAVSTNELLGSLPQVSNFFNARPEQDPRGADRLQVNRPNLRNLPGINSATGGTTLILVDGHRMTPMGVDQSSFDPDFIPPSIIERVEVITDGGSSIYGADAVGGVINFITTKKFEGVQLDLDYGYGDDYRSTNAALTGGTSWQNGSGYIAVNKAHRDEVLNKDRDWAAQGVWNADGSVLSPADTQCVQPVGAQTTWFWYGAGWTDNPLAPGAGTTPIGTACDRSAEDSMLPEQQRDSIFAGLTQELSDTITLDMKAYYGERTNKYSVYPLGDTISQPSPTDLGLVGSSIGELYQTSAVGFSYGANPAYVNRHKEVDIQTYGISPELTIDLDDGWQLRNTLHWGRSDSRVSQPKSNYAKLVDYVNQGLIDPSNIAATDSSVINDILNYEKAGQAIQNLLSVRMIADGPIVNLPAGELRAAIGVEYAKDSAQLRKGDVPLNGITGNDYKKGSRELRSAFGELSVPVTSMLDLSLSVRYDDYTDFGSTTNPKVGFDFTPLDWLKIYGHWGKSFNAPTVLDSLGTAQAGYYATQAAGVPDPNNVRDPSREGALVLEGAGAKLLPQTATIWDLGFKVEPISNLVVSTTYYEIDFEDLLGAPNPQLAQAVLLNPDKFIFNPTQAQLDSYLAATENGAAQYSSIDAADVGVIVDRRLSNTNKALLKGFDFSVSYLHDTSFGTMTYGFQANKQLKEDLTQNGTVVDQLVNVTDLTMSGNIGWAKDNVRAKLTLNYTDGFKTDIAVNQDSVDSFLVTNLFVGYDFEGNSPLTDGLSLRFNIDNLFDEDPPLWRQQRNLNYSSWTLGRVFKLGLTKRFD